MLIYLAQNLTFFQLLFMPVEYCIVQLPATTWNVDITLYVLQRSHCWNNDNCMYLIFGPYCLQFLVNNVNRRGITSFEGTRLLEACGLDFFHYTYSEYMTLTVLFYILLSSLLSSGSSNRELCREKFLGSVSRFSIGLLGILISFFSCFISSLIAGFLSRQDFRASWSALCLWKTSSVILPNFYNNIGDCLLWPVSNVMSDIN